jgi:hypothetical protein
MSHPVFLTSSTFSRMPRGSQNQWAEFFQSASFELEANAFIPILWFMLFKQENIFWTRYIDDLDINDDRNQVDLEERQEDFGESQYAYLVIDQQQALLNLAARKPLFIEIFGTENIYHFDDFKSLIEQHYPEYILLRTSGLPLDLNDAYFLTQLLQHIENKAQDDSQQHSFIEMQRIELARFDDHPYFFYGVNLHPPILNLTTTENQSTVEQSNHAQSQQHSLETSGLAIWICTAIVAILTIAVWFTTQSALYAGITFLISAFVLGFISSKFGEPK